MCENDRAASAIVAVLLNDAQSHNSHARRVRRMRSSDSHRVLTTPVEFGMLSIKNSRIDVGPVGP